MTRFSLEDFGDTTAATATPSAARPAPPAPDAPDRFDEGYTAGWEDAVARIDADQARLGTDLLETLRRLEKMHVEAAEGVVAALEPALRDIFDTLLPRAAQSAFLPVLVDELVGIMRDEPKALTVLVAPEEAQALERLLERTGRDGTAIRVKPEPALALTQALIRWEGQERRIDLEAVLAELDGALDAFIAELAPGAGTVTPDKTMKEELAHG